MHQVPAFSESPDHRDGRLEAGPGRMLDLLFPTEEAPGDAEAVQKQPPQQQKRSRAAEDEVA